MSTETPVDARTRGRDDIPEAFTWNLSDIYPSWSEWEAGLGEFERMLSGYAELRGTLAALPDGSPALGHSFESSHPGLFLAGLVTASGFGPAMRFVHGATFTASPLVQGVRRRRRSTPARGAVPLPGGGSRSGAPSPVSG